MTKHVAKDELGSGFHNVDWCLWHTGKADGTTLGFNWESMMKSRGIECGGQVSGGKV